MSKATKRKHVVKEVLEEYVTPTEDQQIMRVQYSLWTQFGDLWSVRSLKTLFHDVTGLG